MGTTPGSKIKWLFWQVVFSLADLSRAYVEHTDEMILQALSLINMLTWMFLALKKKISETTLWFFWSDLLWNGVLPVAPEKPATRLTIHAFNHYPFSRAISGYQLSLLKSGRLGVLCSEASEHSREQSKLPGLFYEKHFLWRRACES